MQHAEVHDRCENDTHANSYSAEHRHDAERNQLRSGEIDRLRQIVKQVYVIIEHVIIGILVDRLSEDGKLNFYNISSI